jgi:hypothetical protein
LAEQGIAVGIIGHRPNRLPVGAIAAIVRDMGLLLGAIATAEPGDGLRAVSNLAEGADRIGAVAALAAGYRLSAILPFARDDFAQDFPASRADFAALLAAADAVTELPGDRADPETAYEAAAQALLAASDILIAVWDGGPSQGRGGTTETIKAAAARGMPVLWIDATGRRPPALHHAGDLSGGLRAAIDRAIS